jgi:hypothetical protein
MHIALPESLDRVRYLLATGLRGAQMWPLVYETIEKPGLLMDIGE